MSSQPSNERQPKLPLSHFALHARQLLRVNTQRAANWFRKPSLSRIKLKFSSSRSRSSPYSSADDATISAQSSSTTLYSPSIRPTAPQVMGMYNSRPIRNTPVIVPIMPTYWI